MRYQEIKEILNNGQCPDVKKHVGRMSVDAERCTSDKIKEYTLAVQKIIWKDEKYDPDLGYIRQCMARKIKLRNKRLNNIKRKEPKGRTV